MIGGDIFMPANSGHVSGIRYNCLVVRHPDQLNGAWNDVIIMLHICNTKLFNFIGAKLPREQSKFIRRFWISVFGNIGSISIVVVLSISEVIRIC